MALKYYYSDRDSYGDFVDSQKLKYNKTVIVDSAIDDTGIHSKDYVLNPTITEEFFNGKIGHKHIDKGIYANDETITPEKNTLAFERKNNPDMPAMFTISPKDSSDYVFTISKTSDGVSQTLKVYDKKGKVVSNIIDPDKSVSNLYALDGGEKYTVEISSSAAADSTYTLTVEQDNWVYAPYGGIWEVNKYSKFSENSNTKVSSYLYYSQNLLYACIAKLVGTPVILSIENVDYVMKNLGYDSNDYQVSVKDDVLQVIFADASFVFGIYSFGAAFAAEGIVALIGSKAALAGTASTAIGVITEVVWSPNVELIKKILNAMEKADIKNALNQSYYNTGEYYIYASDYLSLISLIWDPWTYKNYINKYNSTEDRGTITPVDVDFALEYADWSD